MNKQVGYIASAFLILLVIGIGGFFLSKISFFSNHRDQQSTYNTATENSPVISANASYGQSLFYRDCASCHIIFKDATGPKLQDIIDREPWNDRKKLYKWIRNPVDFMKTDAYTRKLKDMFGSMMTAFPNLTNEEIDAIVTYITTTNQPPSIPVVVAN